MSKFQRRHYEDVAKTLRYCYFSIRELYTDSPIARSIVEQTIIQVMNEFVWLFSNDNPNFKPDKFRKACRVEENAFTTTT